MHWKPPRDIFPNLGPWSSSVKSLYKSWHPGWNKKAMKQAPWQSSCFTKLETWCVTPCFRVLRNWILLCFCKGGKKEYQTYHGYSKVPKSMFLRKKTHRRRKKIHPPGDVDFNTWLSEVRKPRKPPRLGHIWHLAVEIRRCSKNWWKVFK